MCVCVCDVLAHHVRVCVLCHPCTCAGKYRKNTLWVNGLVSAAQAVAARIVSMVACANDVVAGTRSWEYVLGTSDDVQMAAVQLITASRAKLPITSVNKSNLEACKRKLSQAARGLVEATESFRAMQTPKADRVTVRRKWEKRVVVV